MTTQAQDNIIVFDKVNKWYGNNFHVLRDINLQVKRGERIAQARQQHAGVAVRRIEPEPGGGAPRAAQPLRDDGRLAGARRAADPERTMRRGVAHALLQRRTGNDRGGQTGRGERRWISRSGRSGQNEGQYCNGGLQLLTTARFRRCRCHGN